ncbi:MAG: nicotinate-nucleotide adenylyltransferase [Dehalococcoidia bacterium]
MKVGVYGGTFDPPHVGHLLLAEQAREQLRLERVLWVPAGDPWRKSGRTVSSAADRVAMVRAAIEGNDAFAVCELEAEREGPTYSVETLDELHRQRAKDELFFLLGLDALLDLPNWHEPARLIELASLAVAPRGEAQPSVEELGRLLPGLAARVAWVKMPRIDVSGTELRRRAAEGRSLRYAVPDAVARYIRQQRLYRP